MLRVAVKRILCQVIANRPHFMNIVVNRKHNSQAQADAELWGEDPNDKRPIYKPDLMKTATAEPIAKEENVVKPLLNFKKEEVRQSTVTEDQQGQNHSDRLAEFRKKLREDILNEKEDVYGQHLLVPKKDDPLPPWPDNMNPYTGEVGGPRGLEPTRFGDWERKGICIDF